MTKRLHRKLVWLFILVAASLWTLPVSPASAATGLSATPSIVTFDSVEPGRPVEKSISLTNLDSNKTEVLAKASGEVAQWLSFPDGDTFSIDGNGTYLMRVVLATPVGTSKGTYAGDITVVLKPNVALPEGQTGAQIASGVMIRVTAVVGGEIPPAMTLVGGSVANIEAGSPLSFSVEISNRTSSPLTPSIVAEVYDSTGKTRLQTLQPSVMPIAANTQQSIEYEVHSDKVTTPGTYIMRITVSVGGTVVGTFDKTFTASVAPPSATAPAGTAVGLAVTPGEVVFTGVLPDVSAQKQLSVRNMGAGTASVKVDISGAAAGWITVRPGAQFTVSPSSESTLVVSARAPLSTASGQYEALLIFSEIVTPSGVGGASSQVVSAVRVPVRITVGGKATQSLTATDFALGNTNQNADIPISVVLTNTGNTRISPTAKIEILDTTQQTVQAMHEKQLGALESGESRQEDLSVPSTGFPAPVNLWVRVNVYLQGSSLAQFKGTFDILPEGVSLEKACIGTLMEIDMPTWGVVGEEAKVSALFANTSQVLVTAKLVGTISKDGKTVGEIDTPVSSILPGNKGNLITYFIPDQSGQYEVKGNIWYGADGTRDCSEERTAFMNVVARTVVTGGTWSAFEIITVSALGVVFVFAMIVILFLVRHIVSHSKKA